MNSTKNKTLLFEMFIVSNVLCFEMLLFQLLLHAATIIINAGINDKLKIPLSVTVVALLFDGSSNLEYIWGR